MSSSIHEVPEQSEPSILQKEQPEWLRELRKEAWNAYRDFEMPGRIESLWRYTDPKQFVYSPNGSAISDSRSGSGISTDLKKKFDDGEISGIVCNNQGSSFESILSDELIKAGVAVGAIHEFAISNPDFVKPFLGKIVGNDFGKLRDVNMALWTSGIVVHIPENVQFKKPLHLLTHAPEEGNFVLRTIIIVGEGSEISLIDEHAGGPENSNSHYINAVTETFAGKASHLHHLMVQNLEAGANYFLTHRSNAENDAKTLTVIASLGSKMTKANFGISLTGRGSESELEGFLLGEKRQHFDHHTIHDHLASNTLSNLNFKVVLKDRASSAYTGKIIIGHEAPFSEAYQENRNLLLSPKCRVDSIPELEINQDEVRCSHGAAMGPPDENQLFYLRSRGIPQSEAIQLIAEGFMEDALQRIPEDLKEHLRNYISVRLHGGSTIG